MPINSRKRIIAARIKYGSTAEFQIKFVPYVLPLFGKLLIVNTKRNKRWNGDIAKLSAIYLEKVIEKMRDYGDNVQFSSNGTSHGPNYQILNTAGKKKIFNSSHLLIQADEDEFNDPISATIYPLDQIKTHLVNMNTPTKKTATTRTKSATGTAKKSASPRGGAALAKIKEQIAIQKYEYYKSNRSALPSDIREHSEKITQMMEGGMSAELAFNEAIKLCFEYQE